jgi:hypothetical protein
LWLTPRFGRFILGNDPVPIVQEDGWAQVPVWTNAENLTPTEIRFPDRARRSESLLQPKKIDNISFESVADFKHLGTTLSNQVAFMKK